MYRVYNGYVPSVILDDHLDGDVASVFSTFIRDGSTDLYLTTQSIHVPGVPITIWPRAFSPRPSRIPKKI